MLLTKALLDNLNRVFDTDPGAFVALRVDYAGAMTWQVQDQVLTFTVTSGPGVSLTYDLTQFSLQALAQDIAGRTGYSVSSLSNENAGLSACVLLDGSGSPSQPNGDALLGYTSLLWAFMESNAVELEFAKEAAAAAPLQLSTTTAVGNWLDVLGAQYGVPRLVGEADAQYGPRIIATVIRPASNNVALEMAIQAYTGQPCTVTDVVIWRGAFPLYDGTIHYDGAHTYNQTGLPNYGLFDVNVAYDVFNGGDITSFLNTVQSIVGTLRAAGTHLRSLALTSAITPAVDQVTAPADSSSTMVLTSPLAETFTDPTDSTAAMPLIVALSADALTSPTDSAAGTYQRVLTDRSGNQLTDQSGSPLLASTGALFA